MIIKAFLDPKGVAALQKGESVEARSRADREFLFEVWLESHEHTVSCGVDSTNGLGFLTIFPVRIGTKDVAPQQPQQVAAPAPALASTLAAGSSLNQKS